MTSPPKELITNIVDQKARANPDALYAKYPISDWSYDEGYFGVTRGDLANAVNGAAWWLHNTLGPGTNFETIAYIGPNDLSVAAHLSLFDHLKCNIIISPDPQPAATGAILAERPMRVEYVPSVDDLLQKSYSKFPYEKNFKEAGSEPLVAM
ncbi:hypothetical protein ACLMJK_001062 [Lecanora helva]